ncbi:hypothetical protein DL768_011625 [Monosporascus sp. mg162]|nr:hypothetical protein DL768_011625 [Monosporascus sp. mg162]
MRGLSASRWASSSAASRSRTAPSSHFPSSRLDEPSGLSGDRPTPQQELSRFLKIVSRIRWKLPFLDYGYKLATDRAGRTQEEVEANEIHFKIDFYEIYMHLERAIVHLLGVYGIDVHPSPGLNGNSSGLQNGDFNGNGNGNKTGKLGVPRERISQHQYHVNVLLALDDPGNPLHSILGQGEARRQLWSAKDLRNRWKTADSDETRRYTVAPLETYNLEEMLQIILAALEEAYNMTVRYVQETATAQSEGGLRSSTEQDWGFIADAMDWEAV